ncbi:hypothetical protein D3C76_1349970 [compost metagenome]
MGNRLLTVFDIDRLPVNKDTAFPATGPDAEQTLHGLGTPGADQPGYAKNFTAMQREGDVVHPFDMTIDRMPGGEMLHA